MATNRKTLRKLAVCIRNEGYFASLERGKLYRLIPDTDAAKHRQLRVIDGSGDGYLYPAEYFILVRLPEAVERAVMEAA